MSSDVPDFGGFQRIVEGAQVPVEVAPGYPAILKDVQFADDLQRVMLLARATDGITAKASCMLNELAVEAV